MTSVFPGTDARERLGHRSRPIDQPPSRQSDLRHRLGGRREDGRREERSSRESRRHARSNHTKYDDDDDDRASLQLFSTISKPRLCIEVIND